MTRHQTATSRPRARGAGLSDERARGARRLLPTSLLVAACLAVGCFSPDDDPFGTSPNAANGLSANASGGFLCVPGQQIACACGGGVQGFQACDAMGTGFEACACQSNAASSGSGGSAGVGGSGGAGVGGSTSSAGVGGSGSTSSAGVGGSGNTSSAGVGGSGNTSSAGVGGSGSAGVGGSGSTSSTGVGGSGSTSSTGAGGGGSGPATWSAGFGGALGSARPLGMAIDLAGHIVIAGWFGGSISFGGPTLSTASGTDMFVVKLDADGNHLWSLAFGDLATPKAAFPYGVALDASGNVLLVGDFTGPLDFGGGALPLYGGNDIFVAKLDANGSHVWSHSFGSAGGDTATSVAADAAGHVVLTGWHAGTVSFGGLPLSNGATADFYAVGLDAAGGHVWSRGLGQAGFPPVVATGGASEVILTKGFTGPVDLGGGTLTPTAAGSGNPDVLLGKLDATGAHLWSERFGDGFPQKPVSLAVDPTGHVLVAGRFGGTLDFGAGPLAGQSASNAFVARFDASGAHLWSRGWGSGNGTLSDHMVAADAAGHVFVAGGFLGTIDLGAGNMASAGQLDVSMARFDASGTLVWQRQYGGAPMEYATVLSVGPDGSPVIAGEYAGTPDFGDGPLPSGSSSLFVAKVMP